MGAAGPLVSLIVAVADNAVIGRDGALPWRLPEDLKRFKALTLGKPILMGRKTFESIGRALPGRANLVLTRDRRWSAPGVRVVHSVEEALREAGGSDELVVIGGTEIFQLALPLARRIYLTRVHAKVGGDTFFSFDESLWRELESLDHPADERHPYAFTFSLLERRQG